MKTKSQVIRDLIGKRINFDDGAIHETTDMVAMEVTYADDEIICVTMLGTAAYIFVDQVKAVYMK